MRFFLNALTFAIALALPACMVDKDRYPAPEPCEGKGCYGQPPGGSVTTTTGTVDGGTGGVGPTVEQPGTVHLITSPFFDDTMVTSYTGAATIHALSGASSSTSTTPYGGVNGTTFDFKSVPSGSTWFLVEDTSGGAGGVISTFSFWDLPVLPSVTVPVLDLGMLQNITASLPTVAAKGVSTQAAHIVLLVSKAGARYAGAKITGGSGNADIAYDSGSGYSDSVNATGPAGTAILFNAAVAGAANISITDTATMKVSNVTVQAAPGAATLAFVELP